MSRPIAHTASVTTGLGLMILAMLVAPLIDVFSKLATTSASPTMITAARFVFQGLCMLPFVLWAGSWRSFSWRMSFYHAIRAGVITISMVCFVATLAVMPVADAIAIFFVEPIILTILSSIFLKETVGWRRYTACAVGFIGAMIVIRPSFQEIGYVALLPVVTAFCVAIFAMMTRALAHREEPFAMQFQMALWGIPICAVLLFVGDAAEVGFLAPSLPDITTFMWMAGVGVFAALSGLLSVYAYRAAPPPCSRRSSISRSFRPRCSAGWSSVIFRIRSNGSASRSSSAPASTSSGANAVSPRSNPSPQAKRHR